MEERIALLQLSAPLLTAELAGALQRACDSLLADASALAVIVTGQRDVFSGDEDPAGPGDFLGGTGGPGAIAARALAALPIPTIASIDGGATGAGVELALACDIRIASPRATFGFPYLAQGRIPAAGGTQRLPRIVGRARALELILTGRTMDADEALRIGLVSKLSDDPLAEARRIAARIAQEAPVAVRYLREAVHKGMDLSLDQGLRLEADLYFLLQTTADRVEGINAFLDKRPPRFTGA